MPRVRSVSARAVRERRLRAQLRLNGWPPGSPAANQRMIPWACLLAQLLEHECDGVADGLVGDIEPPPCGRESRLALIALQRMLRSTSTPSATRGSHAALSPRPGAPPIPGGAAQTKQPWLYT